MFKFNAKRIFLTYPQCNLEKEELLESITKIKEPITYTIGQEKHKDGNLHLHAVFIWGDKIHTTSATFFDVKGYHPHIKTIPTVQALANFVQYCKKDGSFITNEVQVLGKRALLFKGLLDEGLTPDYVRRNPEVMQLNLNNLKQWLNFVRPNKVELKNLPKKRHIWISGPRNTGKTTFLRLYELLFDSVGQIPYNDDYGMIPYNCDFIFADEYRGQLTVQSLNRLCDGGAHVNTKGGSLILGQPLVFICSNYSIEECYPNVTDDIRDTLRARFQQYVAPSYPKLPSCEL